MSIEKDKANMRRMFEEVLNQGKLNVLDELIAPNFVVHYLHPPLTPDVAGFKKYLEANRTAFPDLHYVIDDMFGEDDKLVVRFTAKGTHKGPLATMPGIKPTNKPVTFTGIVIARRDANGKGLEVWGNHDEVGVLQQLGLIPLPA